MEDSPPKNIEHTEDEEAQLAELTVSGQSGPERVGEIAHRADIPAVVALTAAEQLHHRREAKTKKELTNLKKAAKTVKKEQEELTHHQAEFEKQLDNKIEQDLKKILDPKPTERPEVVMERVEAAAAHNLPIESLFERRHELKDSSTDKPKAVYTHPLNPAVASNTFKNKIKAIAERPRAQPQPVQTPKNQKPITAQPTLYKQAVVSGFWTAVALLAGVFILVLLS